MKKGPSSPLVKDLMSRDGDRRALPNGRARLWGSLAMT